MQFRDAPQLRPDEILVGLEPVLRQYTGRTRDIGNSPCAPMGARAHAAGAPAEQPFIPHWCKSRARRTAATLPVRRRRRPAPARAARRENALRRLVCQTPRRAQGAAPEAVGPARPPARADGTLRWRQPNRSSRRFRRRTPADVKENSSHAERIEPRLRPPSHRCNALGSYGESRLRAPSCAMPTDVAAGYAGARARVARGARTPGQSTNMHRSRAVARSGRPPRVVHGPSFPPAA